MINKKQVTKLRLSCEVYNNEYIITQYTGKNAGIKLIKVCKV